MDRSLDHTGFYRRHLPHFLPPGAQYFVTARLAGSLPYSVIAQLREEYQEMSTKTNQGGPMREWLPRSHKAQIDYFDRFDTLLNNATSGPMWLGDERVARMVAKSMQFWDGKRYDLLCSTVMANHVHLVFDTAIQLECSNRESMDVTKILASIKSYTAHEANKLLGRSGPFWLGESYDHVIRSQDELENMIKYVLNNPVKAGLVASWHEWPWTYCREDLMYLAP